MLSKKERRVFIAACKSYPPGNGEYWDHTAENECYLLTLQDLESGTIQISDL